MSPPPDRSAALDGLRALALAGVILTHVLPHRFPGGQIGVDVFFALSGYLITSILLREHEALGRIRIGAFYARRALRLTPALVVFLVGATALAVHEGDPHIWGDLAAAATYTTNMVFAFTDPRGSYTGHTWSLAVEEQFYLLWPLVLTALVALPVRRGAAVVAGAAVALLAVNGALQGVGVANSTLFFLPTTRLPGLLAGALAAFVVQRRLAPSALRSRGVSGALAAGALVLILVWMRHDTWSDPWSYRGGFAAVAALTALVILHVQWHPRTLVGRLLALPPLALIGRRSYAGYLWHIPALILAEKLVTDRRELLALTVAMTAVAATVSWHLVELPFLRRKRRFERVTLAGPVSAEATTTT